MMQKEKKDKEKEPCKKPIEKPKRIKSIRVFSARLLFFIHGIVVVFKGANACQNEYVRLFVVPVLLGFLEATIRIKYFKAAESTIFVPSIFLFLSSVVPPIWLMQLNVNHIITPICSPSNNTRSAGFMRVFQSLHLSVDKFDAERYLNFTNFNIELQTFVTVFEQTMLVVVILGRWLMPRGEMSMDHLTQLLLVWLAVGADTVDFYDAVKEEAVAKNTWLTFMVLTVWTVGLAHYPIQLAGKSSHKARPTIIRKYTVQSGNKLNVEEYVAEDATAFQKPISRSFCRELGTNLSFWTTLISILWLDIPFLTVRLYCLIAHNLRSYSMVFFACKNSLIVAVQGYRIYGMIVETYVQTRKKEKVKFADAESIDEALLEENGPSDFAVVEDEDGSIADFKEISEKNDMRDKKEVVIMIEYDNDNKDDEGTIVVVSDTDKFIEQDDAGEENQDNSVPLIHADQYLHLQEEQEQLITIKSEEEDLAKPVPATIISPIEIREDGEYTTDTDQVQTELMETANIDKDKQDDEEKLAFPNKEIEEPTGSIEQKQAEVDKPSGSAETQPEDTEESEYIIDWKQLSADNLKTAFRCEQGDRDVYALDSKHDDAENIKILSDNEDETKLMTDTIPITVTSAEDKVKLVVMMNMKIIASAEEQVSNIQASDIPINAKEFVVPVAPETPINKEAVQGKEVPSRNEEIISAVQEPIILTDDNQEEVQEVDISSINEEIVSQVQEPIILLDDTEEEVQGKEVSSTSEEIPNQVQESMVLVDGNQEEVKGTDTPSTNVQILSQAEEPILLIDEDQKD